MSISGSVIVYRNELSKRFSIEWLVNFHANLASGPTGRLVNGIGAISLTSLCLTGAIIWWPGTKNWRRSLVVNWQSKFPRITWDLHSALGFWCFLFLLVWGAQQSIFLSRGFLTLCSYSILLTTSPTKVCFGCLNSILVGSAGLLRRFGVS
jgi:hypothetical protein